MRERKLVINFSLFGVTEKIVSRKGAKINHVVITSGPFGYYWSWSLHTAEK